MSFGRQFSTTIGEDEEEPAHPDYDVNYWNQEWSRANDISRDVIRHLRRARHHLSNINIHNLLREERIGRSWQERVRQAVQPSPRPTSPELPPMIFHASHDDIFDPELDIDLSALNLDLANLNNDNDTPQ